MEDAATTQARGLADAIARVADGRAAEHVSERRAHRRGQLEAAVDLSSDSNFYVGFSEDISEGGLFVATVAAAEVGDEVEVRFTLPWGEPIEARGVVRWTREPNDGTPDVFPGLGVQFVGLDDRAREAIRGFVASREPMFFAE
ncbi:MAG: TIGR02266 family protein [Myxococcales bacterium]|nr:TIGR02266 family protein [Myxococcales bacterium]